MQPWYEINAASPELFMETVTGEIAEYFLDNYYYRGERKIKPTGVEKYTTAMNLGEFGEALLRFMVYDDDVQMTNGHHTCMGIRDTKIPKRLPIRVKAVSSLAEIEFDYNTTDVGIPRSLIDLAPRDRLREKYGLNERNIVSLGGAAPYVLSGFSNTVKLANRQTCESKQARLAFIENWAGTYHDVLEAIAPAGKSTKIVLRRAPLVALMVVMAHDCPQIAIPFWSDIAIGSDLRKGTSKYHLRRFLLEEPQRYQSVSGQIYCRYVVSYWNAHVQGREIQATKLVVNNEGKYNRLPIIGTAFSIAEVSAIGRRKARNSKNQFEE